ncbi:unnamed protein product [Absidia cylindrospora]
MKFSLSIVGCILVFTASVSNACHGPGEGGQCSIRAKVDIDGRAEPNVDSKRTPNVYKKGDCIKVRCQATGDEIYGSSIWDFDGKYYLPDHYIKTGYDGFDPHIKRCRSTPPPPVGEGCGGHLNAKGLSLIKELEGWNDTFYDDGRDKYTIGYGHNCDADSTHCANLHPPISRAEGESLLKKDVSGFESYICKTVVHELKCPLNCNQFGALVSFVYNVGTSSNGFPRSKLYEDLAANCNYKATSNDWIHSFTNNGDLVNRRKKELTLWTTPTTSASGC